MTGTLTFVGAGAYVLFHALPNNRGFAQRVPVLTFGIGLIAVGAYRWRFYKNF